MAEFDLGSNGGSPDTDIENYVSDVKILVVGNQRVGKTTFIRTFGEGNFPDPSYEENGATVYPCNYHTEGETKRFAFVEIPGGGNPTDTLAFYSGANSCVFMYAIDDPVSFINLDQWIGSVLTFLDLPMKIKIVVGFKKDLRDNPQVIQRLALDNRTPVTEQQGLNVVEEEGFEMFFECSANDAASIAEAGNYVLESTFEMLE